MQCSEDANGLKSGVIRGSLRVRRETEPLTVTMYADGTKEISRDTKREVRHDEVPVGPVTFDAIVAIGGDRHTVSIDTDIEGRFAFSLVPFRVEAIQKEFEIDEVTITFSDVRVAEGSVLPIRDFIKVPVAVFHVMPIS